MDGGWGGLCYFVNLLQMHLVYDHDGTIKSEAILAKAHAANFAGCWVQTPSVETLKRAWFFPVVAALRYSRLGIGTLQILLPSGTPLIG